MKIKVDEQLTYNKNEHYIILCNSNQKKCTFYVIVKLILYDFSPQSTRKKNYKNVYR